MMVNGGKILQFLKVQSCLYIPEMAFILGSSGSCHGHNWNDSQLNWPILLNVACHSESMTLHLENNGATDWCGH